MRKETRDHITWLIIQQILWPPDCLQTSMLWVRIWLIGLRILWDVSLRSRHSVVCPRCEQYSAPPTDQPPINRSTAIFYIAKTLTVAMLCPSGTSLAASQLQKSSRKATPLTYHALHWTELSRVLQLSIQRYLVIPKAGLKHSLTVTECSTPWRRTLEQNPHHCIEQWRISPILRRSSRCCR